MCIIHSKAASSVSIQRESLIATALISAAAFVGTPRISQATTTYIGTGDTSWFDVANWKNGNVVNGMLPESGGYTSNELNLNADNATMPTVGVLFDPAAQIANASYIAKVELPDNTGTFYVASANIAGNPLNSAPNKLTIDSGTLELYYVNVGRDSSGQITQNGGLLQVDHELKIGGSNTSGDFATTLNGSGTYEYHGGTLVVSAGLSVGTEINLSASPTSLETPEVGKFVVYNDQVSGAILVNNGTSFAVNTYAAGTTGIVEFHYDNDLSGVGNVRPIQCTTVNSNNATLELNNGPVTGGTGNLLSELNFVVDDAVSVIGGSYQNLGLFTENTIGGYQTWPKIFYATDGVTGYTQGATISSVLAGVTYSWTISYSGVITFTNTATSAYNSAAGISATGGNDVVLIGVSVPEPTSIALLGGTSSLILARRRRNVTPIG